MSRSRRVSPALALVLALALLGLSACTPPKKKTPVYACDAGTEVSTQAAGAVPPAPSEPLGAEEAGEAAKAAVAGAEVVTADGQVPLVTVEETPAGPEINTIPVNNEAEAEAVAETAAADGNLVAVEADAPVSADAPPNDPRFGEQYALPRTRFTQAWDAYATEFGGSGAGAGMQVAVLDTGVHQAHEDLDLGGKVVAGPSFRPAAEGVSTTDLNGHGTIVAGIIAAETNNAVGIAGGAPAATIVSVKVLDRFGNGSTAAVAVGVMWSVDHGVDVINLSLGGQQLSAALHEAIKHAVNMQVPVISSAGNNGKCGTPSFPGAFDEVLAVGATGTVNEWAPFSTTGPYISLVAPGVSILSTTQGATDAYATRSGTSFSAPYVSAAAAIVRARHSGFSTGQVYLRLIQTALELGAPGWDPHFGHGLLNVHGAAA
jgi:subtilisin family serine protease